MTSIRNLSSLSHSESAESPAEMTPRSKSLFTPILIECSYVQNIGSLDQLGNFKLDPSLKSSLTGESLSYWERLKIDFFNRSENEVKIEAKKIISEVLTEVLQNSPAGYSEFIGRLLSETM